VKPAAAGLSVGGFFFWEDGDIRLESPYEEFLLEGERSLAGDQRILSSPDRVAAVDDSPARRGWPNLEPATAWNPEDGVNTAPPRTPDGDRRSARPAWPGRGPAKVENPERSLNAPIAPAPRTPTADAGP